MRFHQLTTLLFLAGLPLAAAQDSIELKGGVSPDGTYVLRMIAPPDKGSEIPIRLIEKSTSRVAGEMSYGGYGFYPSSADEMNAAVLWAPDSKSFALMTRGTKRSREIRVFQLGTDGNFTQTPLPSVTEAVYKVLKAKEAYRTVFEEPARWTDADTLILKASGGVPNPKPDQPSVWYEAEVTYDLKTRAILGTRVISTREYAG